MKPVIYVVVLLALAGGAWRFYQHYQTKMPDYLASGNGRVESEMVHVAAKSAGRVIDVLVDEGDMVQPQQVLAHLDTDELNARLAAAKAGVAAAQEGVVEAQAQIVESESRLKFATKELERATPLAAKKVLSQAVLESRENDAATAAAAVELAKAHKNTAQHQVDAAAAEVKRIETLMEETTLVAPVKGRVQHRLAEPGEVLAAGGRVVSLIDLENVYMTIFLPTAQAGQLVPGDEARIVLDAYPDYVIPAEVSFVSAEAQFTPKEVETQSERAKLMFRVKVSIPRVLLQKYVDQIRTGLPGVAYVMLQQGQEWPDALMPNLPE
jgi:HlyD family secretion protein